MPKAADLAEMDRPLAAYLDAHLLLAEDAADEAAAGFQSLIDQPLNQSLLRYHSAAVGLADALVSSGQNEAAVSFLLAFIQEHPKSPELRSPSMSQPSLFTISG